MNDPRPREEQLLAELFHDDWADGPAAAFARHAAALARTRRRLRSVAALGAAVGGVLLVAAFVFTRHRAAAPLVTSRSAPPPAYDIISDRELLARLHDRPILILPKQNGVEKFVLLDR